MNQDLLQELYRSLQSRRRPEDVAEICARVLHKKLPAASWHLLQKAAKGALINGAGGGYTSMSQDFQRPVGLAAQLPNARLLFPDVPGIESEEADKPDAVTAYLMRLNADIGKNFGFRDFKSGRLENSARRKAGITGSRRQYNRRFRYLGHMERKLEILRREWRKYEFTRIAKTKLATHISLEEFARDAPTACFIAYYAARCNLRSEFTNTSQQRPFDEICAALLNFCGARPGANWWAIAHIYPDAAVLEHLSEAQKGELLGRWAAILEDVSDLLREVWSTTEVDLDTMIVRRGNDSTTWNATAGAWNKAREGWFALLEALGLESVLDVICPGKVPRLMAADVAYWHRISGGGLHPDTQVWAQIPRPWDVLSGAEICTRAQVETACLEARIDPQKSGWTKVRPRGGIAEFRPTPELVHGVSIAHPVLAKILREAGVFSGKTVKGSIQTPDLN